MMPACMLPPMPAVGDTLTVNVADLFAASYQYPAQVVAVDPDTFEVDVHVNSVGVTVYGCRPFLGEPGAANRWLWPSTKVPTKGTNE